MHVLGSGIGARSLIVVVAMCLALGCGADDGSDSGANGTAQDALRGDLSGPNGVKRQLLESVSENVIIPALVEFAESATALQTAAETYASDPSETHLTAAQNAWREAMKSWQRVEVMQIGPAGMMGEVLGGDDRRDEIYSWPVTNACRIDQETLEDAHKKPAELEQEGVNTRGLDAIEYLLFHPPEGNACKINSAINAEGTWESMEGEITSRQSRYAAVAAQLVVEQAESLLARWTKDGGNYAAMLKEAGSGSLVYGSLQEGLNAVSDAMFYVEKTMKDRKLGEPLGFIDCELDTCPDALEHRYALMSKEAALANLEGFKELFHGGNDAELSVGFDDLLRAYGADELAAQMDERLNAAIAALEDVPTSFKSALATDIERLEAAYSATKDFTDLFKTQFMSVLDLEIPQRAASDND